MTTMEEQDIKMEENEDGFVIIHHELIKLQVDVQEEKEIKQTSESDLSDHDDVQVQAPLSRYTISKHLVRVLHAFNVPTVHYDLIKLIEKKPTDSVREFVQYASLMLTQLNFYSDWVGKIMSLTEYFRSTFKDDAELSSSTDFDEFWGKFMMKNKIGSCFTQSSLIAMADKDVILKAFGLIRVINALILELAVWDTDTKRNASFNWPEEMVTKIPTFQEENN